IGRVRGDRLSADHGLPVGEHWAGDRHVGYRGAGPGLDGPAPPRSPAALGCSPPSEISEDRWKRQRDMSPSAGESWEPAAPPLPSFAVPGGPRPSKSWRWEAERSL